MTFSRQMLSVIPLIALAIYLEPATTQAQAAKTVNPYAAQITALRTTAKLLQQADHDYKGHRAAAVHEIHVAIHSLQPVGKKPVAPKGGTGAGKGGKEPQNVSDAQLAQAIVQLKAIAPQLANAPPAALTAVQTAVSQLEIALTIK